MRGHKGSSGAGQHGGQWSGRGPRLSQSQEALLEPGGPSPHQFHGARQGVSAHQSMIPRGPHGATYYQSATEGSAQGASPTLPVFPVNRPPPVPTARLSWQASTFTRPSQPRRPSRSVASLVFSQVRQGPAHSAPSFHHSQVPFELQTAAGQPVLVPQTASDQPHQQPTYFPPSGPPPHPSDPPLASQVWPPYLSVSERSSCQGVTSKQLPIHPHSQPLPPHACLTASPVSPLCQMVQLAPHCPGTPPRQFQLSAYNARPQSFLSARSPPADQNQTLPQGAPKGNSPHTFLPRRAPQSGAAQQSPPQGAPRGATPHPLQGAPQGTSPMVPASSAQGQSLVAAAETFWCKCVQDWYPNFDSQTYFVPPLHFNKVLYDVKTAAGQPVLVPKVASDQPHQQPASFPPSGPPPHSSDPPLASRVWPDQPVPSGPLPVAYDADVRDDIAMQQARNFIKRLAERLRGKERVMLVLSQLDFRKYLDDQVNPINAAAVSLLPRPAILGPAPQLGKFDLLMVSLLYGLIVAEIKSVGADLSKIPDLDQAVVKAVRRAVGQLEKAGQVLSHLVSDLAPVRVIKTLILPNITAAQLAHALASDPQVQQALCHCLGVPVTDAAAAVSRCLCKDDFNSPTSSVWWQRTVTDHGPDANMTRELYERLFARFCGPATTIEVPTVTAPRRAVGLRTLREGVALTGVTMATLTLYPQQVDLVNRRGMPRVFLHGPPGTGKTVLLLLKAIQWLHKGREVHLLSTHRDSRAATRLIEHQLLHAPPTSATAPTTPTSAAPPTAPTSAVPAPAEPTSATAPATARVPPSATAAPGGPRVHTHFYDFKNNKGDVKAAVEELESVTRDGELYVIIDEAYPYGSGFADFCTDLANKVPSLHLWAAAVRRDTIPGCLSREELAIPVRCPPSVVREVAGSVYVDGSKVPRYQDTQSPSATEGPGVMRMQHWERPRLDRISLPGHTKGMPEYCAGCAERVVHLLLEELRLGRTGVGGLQWRDVLVLCESPGDNLPVVTCLRACGVPVQVLTRHDDEQAVRDVALAVHDAVTVTDYKLVSGLERRVVVVMAGYVDDVDRLWSVSRSTSLVVHVGDLPL